MFAVLPESRAPRTRRVGGTITSVILHGAAIAGAVTLTMAGSAGARATPPEPARPPVVFVAPHDLRPAGAAARGASAPKVPAAPRLVRPVIDVTIPRIPAFDADPVAHAAPPEVALGRGIPDGGPGLGSGALGGRDGIVDEHEADRAPHVQGDAPVPRYPDLLRGAGITGRVVAQFVVDTLGHAEPASVELVECSRPEFGAAVRQVLPRYRFVPGEVSGHPVRTRVLLPFTFTLR